MSGATDEMQGQSQYSLSEEEEKRILAMAPKGTWALLLVLAAFMFGTWALLFFGMFMGHGPVT